MCSGVSSVICERVKAKGSLELVRRSGHYDGPLLFRSYSCLPILYFSSMALLSSRQSFAPMIPVHHSIRLYKLHYLNSLVQVLSFEVNLILKSNFFWKDRESRAVDTESLCVLAGRSVWAIRLDIHILDNGG